MLPETVTNIRVDLSEGHARIAKDEVVLPTFQVPVQFLSQLRNWLEALVMIRHLVQLFPLLLQSLRRRAHVKVPPPLPFQVVAVAERESQKVQTRSLFF